MAKIHLAHLNTLPPKKTQKKKILAETEKIIEGLDELQNLLYAQSKHAVLVVIQGMDAAGILAGEVFGLNQLISMLLILAGVYITNRYKK